MCQTAVLSTTYRNVVHLKISKQILRGQHHLDNKIRKKYQN